MFVLKNKKGSQGGNSEMYKQLGYSFLYFATLKALYEVGYIYLLGGERPTPIGN